MNGIESEFQKPIIRFFHVYKRYGSDNALVDITFDIGGGEFLFVTGPSGAGKSTLLKLMYLGETSSDGQIIVDGINLSRVPDSRIPLLRRKFGIIFQDYKLIPSKNVYDNVALIVEALGAKRRIISKKTNILLRAVGMEKKGLSYPPGLSGGEQQRVAVARAIAGNPKIILADEPTSSLDPNSAKIIFDLLKQFNAQGTTVIIATHDTELIRKTGGRVMLLKEGHLETSTVIPKMSY